MFHSLVHFLINSDDQNCNGGFIVPHATRGKGASHALAKGFIIYAPKLGYRASVFNLVYASESAVLCAAYR